MLHAINACAPQVGCKMEEKEVVESISKERIVIGVKERNIKGQMVVDFSKRMKMVGVNTYFKKKEKHKVVYNLAGRCTQVDYVLCRRT